MTEEVVLRIYTLYDHPLDDPDHVVAREWAIRSGGVPPVPTGVVWRFGTLGAARGVMVDRGLTAIPRDPADDPVIVETWV